MENVVFIIVFFIATACQIYLLLSKESISRTTMAGDVDKFCFAFQMSSNKHHEYLIVNNDRVDVSKDMSLIVCGESMQKYNIHNGQRVYIRCYKGEDYKNIKGTPILLIKYKHHKNWLYKLFASEYKLRKFIGYVDDFSKVENLYNENMGISKEQFLKDVQKSKDKLNEREVKVMLSETFDVELCRNRYSVHHADNAVGMVRYAV